MLAYVTTYLKRSMKGLWKLVARFARKEWFLLLAVVVIALIILLFELLL